MTLTARCLRCGDVTLHPAQVRLVAYRPPANPSVSRPTHAWWRCEGCGTPYLSEIDTLRVQQLSASNVRTVVIRVDRGDGPALTEDDLITFGRELEGT